MNEILLKINYRKTVIYQFPFTLLLIYKINCSTKFLFIMKKINGILSLLLAFLVVAMSCTSGDATPSTDIKAKLAVLEQSLKQNSLQNRVVYDHETIVTDGNRFESYGQQVYEIAFEIQDSLNKFTFTPDMDRDIRPVVDHYMSRVEYNPQFSELELIMLNSFSSSIATADDKIGVCKAYEELASNEDLTGSTYENFIKFVGTVKYGALFRQTTPPKKQDKSFSDREMCANDCMRAEIESWNPIDWATAVSGFLGGGLYLMYLSCWYDCW